MCVWVSVCVAGELLALCEDSTWVSVQTACDRRVEKKEAEVSAERISLAETERSASE